MELYATVRRSVYVEGLSERAAARRFGLARETVRKMLRYRRPPGYRRAQPVRRPKLDAFTGVIDQILREDQSRPKKQRHTAKRIGERLRAEYGFTGGDTIVKAYVRAQRLSGQEMFVPLGTSAGRRAGRLRRSLGGDRPGSNRRRTTWSWICRTATTGFVQAFPAETMEAFCEGRNAAFRYFGGVPRRIVYDNTKLAGGADSRGRYAPADAGLQRAPVALFVRRPLRAPREGQRHRQGGRAGRVRPPQLLRADPSVRQLGRVERRPRAPVR